MHSIKRAISRFRANQHFGSLAAILVVGCSGASGREVPELGVQQEALQFTRRVRVEVLTVMPGFTPSMMTNALATANTVWAPSGIQFDFNSATDVMDPGLPQSACDDGAALGAFGNTIVGKIAVFFCASNWSGGGDNVVSWEGDNGLAHELGHYFHLSHIFRECWVAEDEDKPPVDPHDDCGGVWYSVEHCIRAKLEGASLPAECPNLSAGAAIRDYLLDGDGIADTGISLHLDPSVGNPCAPGYTVPLIVNFTNGSTGDYSFHPVTNNDLGYFGCSPAVLSPTQTSIAREALLVGNRNHLIAKQLVAWDSSFSNANGWGVEKYYSTIGFPDVNGGRADVCGRGIAGINCAISNGSAFTGATLWSSSFSDANGWGSVQYYSTIKYPDVNGGGQADVCGRGVGGIVCALSNGSSAFTGATVWSSAFSDANGWSSAKYYSTIGFPDVNGGGRADVCGRGIGGIVCALSNGSAFTGAGTWDSSFSDANGWGSAPYYSTIRYPDVNTGGQADVCGRGSGGIVCAISNGSAFTGAATWASSFSDANGWNQPQYYGTIAFPDLNHDNRADVCGRGSAGIVCGISNGSSFTNVQTWTTEFSDADGWNQPQFYSTLSFPDLDNDGFADVCGRGSGGVYCAYSNGSAFVDFHLYSANPSDANGWNLPQNYSTLKFAKVDTDAQPDLCGRGSAGIVCEQ